MNRLSILRRKRSSPSLLHNPKLTLSPLSLTATDPSTAHSLVVCESVIGCWNLLPTPTGVA